MDKGLTIEGICTELPDEKRLYLPGIVLKSTCPKCGQLTIEHDLASDYLSYGNLHVGFCCYAEEQQPDGSWKGVGCNHEWYFDLKATIRLELIT